MSCGRYPVAPDRGVGIREDGPIARKPTKPDLSSLAGRSQDPAPGRLDSAARPFDDLDDLDDLGDLDYLDDLDDEESLAALDEEDREAAALLMEMLGDDLRPMRRGPI